MSTNIPPTPGAGWSSCAALGSITASCTGAQTGRAEASFIGRWKSKAERKGGRQKINASIAVWPYLITGIKARPHILISFHIFQSSLKTQDIHGSTIKGH